MDSFLYYCDESTMEPVPLCAKPNCKHNEETDEAHLALCNAYFNRTNYYGGQVFWSEGQVYVYTTASNKAIASLYEVSADGSSRREVITGLQTHFGMADCMVVHRGMFYIADTYYDESLIKHDCIKAYSLHGHKSEPQTIFTNVDEAATYITNLRVEGNTLSFWELSESSSYVAYQVPLSGGVAEIVPDNPYESLGLLATMQSDGKRFYRLKESETSYFSSCFTVYDTDGKLLISQDFGTELKGIRGLYVSPRKYAFIVDVALTGREINGCRETSTAIYYFDLTQVDSGHISLTKLIEQFGVD
ncbi:MAG: hypothetical protein VB111_10870 [Clostridiaceae bacterium]|nr:hypothetical protein [Clostridiaceae bacterium]